MREREFRERGRVYIPLLLVLAGHVNCFQVILVGRGHQGVNGHSRTNRYFV